MPFSFSKGNVRIGNIKNVLTSSNSLVKANRNLLSLCDVGFHSERKFLYYLGWDGFDYSEAVQKAKLLEIHKFKKYLAPTYQAQMYRVS